MNPIGTEEELQLARTFVVGRQLAVLSTLSPSGAPESALMGMAVTPQFSIVFDTLSSTRKYANLVANGAVAVVIGCTGPVSVQYEGVARELTADELEPYLDIYFEAFPDGRERRQWAGMTYFLVEPRWLRFCDYSRRPPLIREFEFPLTPAE